MHSECSTSGLPKLSHLCGYKSDELSSLESCTGSHGLGHRFDLASQGMPDSEFECAYALAGYNRARIFVSQVMERTLVGAAAAVRYRAHERLAVCTLNV